jgi:Family of unknown function (DUF6889)
MNEPVEEWVLQIVEAGMCRYESLIDGTLSLEDVARMVEYLTIQAENKARINDHYRDR